MRKGHVCQKNPDAARVQSLRSPRVPTPPRVATPFRRSVGLSSATSTPKKAKKATRVHCCAACVIAKSITQIVQNCDSAEVNVATLEADLNDLQDQAQNFIAKLLAAVNQVKELVHEKKKRDKKRF